MECRRRSARLIATYRGISTGVSTEQPAAQGEMKPLGAFPSTKATVQGCWHVSSSRGCLPAVGLQLKSSYQVCFGVKSFSRMASPGDLSCPAYMPRGCLQSPAPQTAEQPGPLGELSSWKVLEFLFWKTRYAWARMEEAS